MVRFLNELESSEQPDCDDGQNPDECDDDGQTVEVALGNSGGSQCGRHSPAEHVREAAAASTVKKYGEGQQDTGDREDYLHDDVENVHDVSSLGDDVARELNNLGEFLGVETRTTDQCAVDVVFAKERRDVG